MPICTKCLIDKDNNHFRKCSKNKNGLQYQCKDCVKIKAKQEYYKYKDKNKYDHLYRKYNLTKKEYVYLLNKQNNRCAICGNLPTRNIKGTISLCVDHCHKTGKIRGLLCHSCNAAIGLANEDVKILQLIYEYITNEKML